MRKFLLLSLLLFSNQSAAKQLVLVQGYLADSNSWQQAGITQILKQQGWQYAGEFYYSSHGVGLTKKPVGFSQGVNSQNQFYLVSIPTEASIQNQAYYLTAYLQQLRNRYPRQRIILVGHSAGGVLARYVMVRKPELNIEQLITIASPHLGTDTAEFGKLLGDSPIAWIAPWVGAGTLTRSNGLYSDLQPEMPNRFLYWLNRQPHPPAEYISIVRDQLSPSGGDFIVPQGSQYLEQVESLKGRARSYIVNGSHELNAKDGWLLLDLINERMIQTL